LVTTPLTEAAHIAALEVELGKIAVGDGWS